MAEDLLPRISHINRTMWIGWALMALGIVSICSPFMAGKTAVYLVGFFLLAAGLGLLLESFQTEGVSERILTLVLGAITSVSAIFVFVHPLLGLGVLTFILVGYFVADGLWKIIAAFSQYVCTRLVLVAGKRHPLLAPCPPDLAGLAGIGTLCGRCPGWSKSAQHRHCPCSFRQIAQGHVPECSCHTARHEDVTQCGACPEGSF